MINVAVAVTDNSTYESRPFLYCEANIKRVIDFKISKA